MAHNGRPRGMRSGDIDMAGISTKLDTAVRGGFRNDSTSLISCGIQQSLFTYDRTVVRQHDEDLDAALRSRGHPGMRIGATKSQTSISRVPAVKVQGGALFAPPSDYRVWHIPRRMPARYFCSNALTKRWARILRAAVEAETTPADDGLPQTGDEAVEFFGRTGEDSEVKVLFMNRAQQHLNFRPYDLVVVDRTEIDPEHFTMSASGVVQISPGALPHK